MGNRKIDSLPQHIVDNDIEPENILSAFNCIASLSCSYEHGLYEFLTKKQQRQFDRLCELAEEFHELGMDLWDKTMELRKQKMDEEVYGGEQ